MASTDFTDPYLDPDTRILRNKIGARDQVALTKAEGDLVFARMVELESQPRPKVTGTLAELRQFHRFLFQDIYDWAGEIRTVDVRKNTPGAQPFLPVAMIGRAAAYCETELANDRLLAGLERESFIECLARHYDQFNYVHPFREGNGRAQRVFWTHLAEQAGWQLDWQDVTGQDNDAASRAASDDDNLEPLKAMFERVVTGPTAELGESTETPAERARRAFGHAAPSASDIAERTATVPQFRPLGLDREWGR